MVAALAFVIAFAPGGQGLEEQRLRQTAVQLLQDAELSAGNDMGALGQIAKTYAELDASACKRVLERAWRLTSTSKEDESSRQLGLVETWRKVDSITAALKAAKIRDAHWRAEAKEALQPFGRPERLGLSKATENEANYHANDLYRKSPARARAYVASLTGSAAQKDELFATLARWNPSDVPAALETIRQIKSPAKSQEALGFTIEALADVDPFAAAGVLRLVTKPADRVRALAKCCLRLKYRQPALSKKLAAKALGIPQLVKNPAAIQNLCQAEAPGMAAFVRKLETSGKLLDIDLAAAYAFVAPERAQQIFKKLKAKDAGVAVWDSCFGPSIHPAAEQYVAGMALADPKAAAAELAYDLKLIKRPDSVGPATSYDSQQTVSQMRILDLLIDEPPVRVQPFLAAFNRHYTTHYYNQARLAQKALSDPWHAEGYVAQMRVDDCFMPDFEYENVVYRVSKARLPNLSSAIRFLSMQKKEGRRLTDTARIALKVFSTRPQVAAKIVSDVRDQLAKGVIEGKARDQCLVAEKIVELLQSSSSGAREK